MENEIIDVDYAKVDSDTNDKKEPVDITVNTDPISALFSSIASVVNTVTNSVKEYNMCCQQEKTKRAEIKAKLKSELAQIEANKEVYLKLLEDKHEENMMLINNMHHPIKDMSNALQAAIEMAKQNNDIEILLKSMTLYNQCLEIESKVRLQNTEQICSSNPVGFIDFQQPKGYLT